MATQTLFPTQTPFASIRKMRDDLMYEIYILQKTMPRSDSQAYIAPTKSEVSDFTQLISLLLAGDTSKALQMASRINYTLLQYSDLHDNNQPSIVLRENKGDLKGWGLYALRMISDSPVVIEAPHPLADGQTAEIALQLYRGLDARALLVAGSHRNANADGSSDVAHQQASIFQAVHDSLVMPGSVVLQVHGFSSTKHSDHPQVIIGQSGSGDSLLAGQIAKALEEAGVSSGVCAGDAWKDLCGETNAQASTIGEGIFLHLELDETIRSRPKTFLKVMEEIFVP